MDALTKILIIGVSVSVFLKSGRLFSFWGIYRFWMVGTILFFLIFFTKNRTVSKYNNFNIKIGCIIVF